MKGRAISSASSTVTVLSTLRGDIFDWEKPQALRSVLAIALRNNSEIYGTFVGFPDGAFVQIINLRNAETTRRNIPGLPDDAVTVWRVIGSLSEQRSETARWRYFDADGKEIILRRDHRD